MPSVSAQYSIVLRVEIDHRPGMLGLVATAIGEAGGSIGSVDLVAIEHGHTLRDITLETAGEEHAARIGEAVTTVDGARLVDITDRTFQMHVGGKIEQRNKLPVRNRDDLSMAYTPGVARVCTAIARDRDKAFQYTIKRNTVSVVSDGSAVLGLGDSRGAVHTDRADYQDGSMPPVKRWFAETSNPEKRAGAPADVIDGADLFVGLSCARVMPPEALGKMNRDAIVFAMANPNPEIRPEEAQPYARVIATGRSDYPNQINNVLCFPGIFRGALDVRARDNTEEMKMAAARGIASIVADSELSEDYVIPSVFNRDVAGAVAAAVADQAKAQGAAVAHGSEIGYSPGETEEFRAVRP
jgi:malic enzyme